MGHKDLDSIVVIGDFAIDRIITPQLNEYEELVNFIQTKKNLKSFRKLLFEYTQKKRVPFHTQLGGPLPNICQFLRIRERAVSGYSVVGNDRLTRKYIRDLNTLEVDTSRFVSLPGISAECIYALNSPTEHDSAIWLPHVTAQGSTKLPQDFFNSHGIMIVSEVNLSLAYRALNSYSGMSVLNPGSEVFSLNSSSDASFLGNLLSLVTVLSTNKEELRRIKELLGINGREFFDRFPRLEYLLTTKDASGACLMARNYFSVYDLNLQELGSKTPPGQIVDTIGAGDAFLASAVDAISRGTNPEDLLITATMAAQESLKYRGAYIPRLWDKNATVYASISRTE